MCMHGSVYIHLFSSCIFWKGQKQKYPFSCYSSHISTFQSLEISSLSPTQESLNILFFLPGVFFVLFLCPKSLQLCPTLCHPIDCSSPDYSIREIPQARILEWVAMSSSRGIFLTQGSNPHLLQLLHFRQILYRWAAGGSPIWTLG